MSKLEQFSIKPIEKAIINHTSPSFVINKNYEIVIPESGKSLLHPNYYDGDTLWRFFEKLYAKKENFIPNDVEVDSRIFLHRLNALSMFLKRRGEDGKSVGRIINNINPFEGNIKIEPLTLRIFDDFRNPIFSKSLMKPETKAILNGFCQQWEVEKQELLMVLEKISL